jgi:ATP-binding cassette subfamily F protein uup
VRKGARLALVEQDPRLDLDATIEQIVFDALGGLHLDDQERHGRAARALGRFGFEDLDRSAGELSGGWRKRLSIVRALALEPDLLILDEPTNHLDLEGILEMEELLKGGTRACLVTSHDRYFLERVATRMLELDRVYPSGLLAVDGSYSDLLERRDEVRRNQQEYEEVLANRARREVEWLRRGPKARTTKSKARIDEAHRLLGELGDTRARNVSTRSAGIDFEGTGRRTKRLLSARGIEKSFGGRRVLDGIDLELGPGVRVGVLGANGSGKTTLLSILAGQLEPDAGEVERAQGLRTVLFEQTRETLDRSLPLRRALAPDSDSVVHLDRAVHVAAWAKRFLFSGEQLDTPVSRLSGGEQARILVARLMLQPADLLILDEPTNDLDIATLEVLEESLLEFPGAIVLVTHDRYLLDRVSTTILALDLGRGTFYAELAQWEAARAGRRSGRTTSGSPKAAAAPVGAKSGKRLPYLEEREWKGIESAILAAEKDVEKLRAAAADPAIGSNAAELHLRHTALAAAETEVDRLYARWTELSAKRG